MTRIATGIIALVLLMLTSGCGTWVATGRAGLRDASLVRVTTLRDSAIVLDDPRLGPDSISGTRRVEVCSRGFGEHSTRDVCARHDTTVAYPLSGLSLIEKRATDPLRTVGAILMVPAIGLGIIWLAVRDDFFATRRDF